MSNNDIKKIIEKAINAGTSLAIEYSKDGETSNIFHLNKVAYSDKYGKDYIIGFSKDINKDLTFKIERIVNIEEEWVEVNDKNIIATQDGLYLIAFDYPFFVELELKIQRKGNKLLEDQSGDNIPGISTYGYFSKLALAYCYIPLYNSNSVKWKDIHCIEENLHKGIYILAYKFVNDSMRNKETRWINNIWRSFKGIYYSPYILRDNLSFEDLDIVNNRHIEVIAYCYCCPEYTL